MWLSNDYILNDMVVDVWLIIIVMQWHDNIEMVVSSDCEMIGIWTIN
jgi:hypothetical protein